MNLEKRFRIFDLLFMQREKRLSAAAFERPFAVGSVPKKIFHGSKQKRTEPAFLPIDALVDFVFDQVGKKALGEILRIVHGVPAAAHETIERRPIDLAKLRERGLRNLRVGLAFSGRENHAPMGRRKGVALTVDGLSQSFHVTGVSESREKNKSRESYGFVQHGLRNPFVKGK